VKIILSLLFILFSIPVFSQRTGVKKGSKENQSYHDYRRRLTVPPYGVVKVKALIPKIKSDDEDNEALSAKDYESLSFREKFTYHMIHAESYSQNCDYIPPPKNEQARIFAYIPDAFEEFAWSERQTKFLSGNRDSVIALMRESMSRTKKAGVNFKQAIVEINAKEMIPDIIATYKANTAVRDLDLLSLLMLLMKDNEYEPFLLSGSYKKLYAEDTSYKSYLDYSKANEELIIKRATDFYNADKK
jgi:hypothetical protein